MEFSDFFKQATDDVPYGYQRRLAEQDLPEVLIAPTGLGKTAAVVLAWLWHRRIAPEATPRRLVYCLPMRTLVEQTAVNVFQWLQRLHDAKLGDHLPGKDGVHALMGGVDKREDHRRRWDETPEHPAVLIGTQDMLLSRALMRGYASGRARWPVEFALLHNDSQWVFDEVQLMGAGLPTSSQLQAFRERLGLALPSRSLWVSATLEPSWLKTVNFDTPHNILRVPEDVPQDATAPNVRRLIEADKPLSRADVAPSGEKKAEIDAYIRAFADLLRSTHLPGQRSLAIVNTVDRARMLYQALKSGIDADKLILIHSRFRPGDRKAQMERLDSGSEQIVIATQAIEAGVDISSAVLFTELAPWPSLVQRFGRVSRRGEWTEKGGAPVYWIDLPPALAPPYDAQELDTARLRLVALSNAAPVHLGKPGDAAPARHVIRQKDLIDLFDTDPDLTGFDVDISPYVRDADDTDVRVFWRDLDAFQTESDAETPRPSHDELCAVSIGRAREWVKALGKRKPSLHVYVPDPQWRKGDKRRPGVPSGWQLLDSPPWPGVTLLVDVKAGGYTSEVGFVGDTLRDSVQPLAELPLDPTDSDQNDGDPESAGYPRTVTLLEHTSHVVAKAEELCARLALTPKERGYILRAGRWHDVGKAHAVFQETMYGGSASASSETKLLAKSGNSNSRHSRPYFRHELASALAYLTHEKWDRSADLIAYLIAAHHGRVRLSLRALPAERAPKGEQVGARFARGVWENDRLPSVDLGGGESFEGGAINLSIMEMGEDPISGASWTERTSALRDQYGPFKLAWFEALLRIADWRASGEERKPGRSGK